MAVYNNLPAGKTEKLTLLWENPSPSTSLASGMLNALSDPTIYDHYRVVWQMTTSVDGNEVQIDYTRLSSQATFSGQTWSWSLAMSMRAGGNVAYTRRISVDSRTQFWVGSADANTQTGGHDDYIIPLRIYGVE